ncbi:MAG: peptide ABC transporter substrate-binding protein [Acetobacteraceae bacterium]|nr:peptide ABC transporter substrate-binding protein [Acetobacteraceae bacterium]
MGFRAAAFAALCLLGVPLAVSRAEAKDDLVIGVAQFPSSLHPDIDAEVIKAYVVDFTLRQITAFDPEWENSCLMCTDLPSIQNGLAKIEDTPKGRGMAVTIKLKPDLKWGDGEPVTAKDLAFTVKVGSDPASGFSNNHPWDRVDHVDVVDDHTAVLHLKDVNYQYNQWDQILPEHIEGPIYAKASAPGDYIKQTAYNRAPTTAGLWNGPYMVAQYQSGAQIVLEQNPNWAGQKPSFKRVVIKLIENTAALQANLLSGDVDMVAGEGVGLTIDQVIALQKQHPDKFNYIYKPSLTYEHIDMKKENPALGDVRVRRALIYALDRQTLVQKLFEGKQPVATTWVNPLDPNYDKDVAQYPFDLARAKSLLAEAGWKPGSDGICRNDRGDRLSLEFATTAGNRLRELVQQVLQSQWRAACVDATVKNEPARTLFGETLKQREYTGLIMYAWSSGVGESPRRTLGTSQIPTQANNWGGNNSTAFSDPKMDSDIDAVERELDPAKTKALWADMQKIYADQVPVVPLFYRAEPHVVPKWLKNYTPTGHGDMSPLWVETWSQG